MTHFKYFHVGARHSKEIGQERTESSSARLFWCVWRRTFLTGESPESARNRPCVSVKLKTDTNDNESGGMMMEAGIDFIVKQKDGSVILAE